MAASCDYYHSWRILLLLLMSLLLTVCVSSSSSPETCNSNHGSVSFFNHLHRRCPIPLASSSPLPLQMDGDSLQRLLSSTSKNLHFSILFYDSDSPFSTTARSKFDVLTCIFPHVVHIAVERSFIMPILFSRYGIHSLPAVFIVNQSGQMRYYGHKDLHSLIQFYKRTTGHDPAECCAFNSNIDLLDGRVEVQPWYRLTGREMIVKEPFLVLAILFLVLRTCFYLYPGVLSRIVAVWNLCKHHCNLGVFGESSQLLGRVVHLIDVKRVWCKVKLCKTRNFQNGARSARVWASSLASVSLGETSSGRASSSLES